MNGKKIINDPYTDKPEFYTIKYKTYTKKLDEVKSIHCYWAYMEKSEKKPACIKKWENSLEKKPDWGEIFLMPFQTFRETKYQSFQYKILHCIIACNHLVIPNQTKRFTEM